MNFPSEERKHGSDPLSAVMIAWTTTATRDDAERLGRGLVEAGLVACAQVDGPITSLYRWDGKVETAQEFRLTLKFAADRETAVRAWVHERHGYQTPQWLGVRADIVSKNYLNWVVQTST